MSLTHMQNVCCFGTPTYQRSRRRLAYDHGKGFAEREANLISRLLYPATDGEPECSHRDLEYKKKKNIGIGLTTQLRAGIPN